MEYVWPKAVKPKVRGSNLRNRINLARGFKAKKKKNKGINIAGCTCECTQNLYKILKTILGH